MRRIAVHRLTYDGTSMEMAVVELEGGYVQKWYPLEGEQAMTEWVGGEASLRKTDNNRIHLYINNELLC